MRTTVASVDFRRAFTLRDGEGPFPPGTYLVETDEELIPSLSFLAYRRISTTIVVPTAFGGSTTRQAVEIDPADLVAALERDAQAS
jgi:hypothetical protein